MILVNRPVRPLPYVPRWPNQRESTYKNELQALCFIARHLDTHSYPPSVSAIQRHLRVCSANTAHTTLERLREKGLLTWEPGQARTLRIIYDRKEG